MSVFVEDCWYFAARVDEIPRDRPLARRIAGRRLVLVRGADGGVFALDDACPHRGMPLRHGRCVDGTIECCYHGWRFDGDGACVEIPGLDGEPDSPHFEVVLFEATPCGSTLTFQVD